MSSPTPAFYRIFFKWIDPGIAFWGAYMFLVTPDDLVNAYIPREMAPRDPNFDMLLHQLVGYISATGLLSFVLLRYTSDMGVWRIFQAAALLQDIAILYGIGASLVHQGRFRLDALRWEDWGSIVITAAIGVIRVAFLAGIGFGSKKPTEKDEKKRA